tara:strand:+ start:15276 stop:15890 length:615 start_codon:yes stop_codon:yes gene_type:complete
MRTKRYYGDQLRGILYPNTTSDAKFDIQAAMNVVGQATAEYVKMSILRDKAFTRTVAGNWVVEYDDVEVKWDEKRKRFYTDLPVNIIALPKDQGVYLVHYQDTPQEAFKPLSIGFLSSRKNSVSQLLEGNYGYILSEDRLIYVQEMRTDCKLTVHLIPNHSELGEMDYFPIDDSCIGEIMRRAVELYMTQKSIPQDKMNNDISE